MKEYLVTGGLGFIGSHLVEELLKDENNRVWVVDDSTNAVWNPRRGRLDADGQGQIRDILAPLMGGYEVIDDPRNPRLVCIGGDFAHRNVLDYVRNARFTGVFHLAGHCSVAQSIEMPLDYLEHNFTKTLELAKACAEGRTRMIFSSSAAVYGQLDTATPIIEATKMVPSNPYGATKMSVENWLALYERLYNLDYIALRYFNVYGPRQKGGSPYAGAIGNFVHSLWMNKPLIVYGDGEQTRDWIHVNDVVQANLHAIDCESYGNHSYNICTGTRTSINSIIEALKYAHPKFKVFYEDARDGEVKHSVGDNTNAKLVLGWKPEITLGAGLMELLAWRGVECKID